MKYRIDNIDYDVIITKKNNKNTYVRVKEDMKIYVTTNYFVTKNSIIKLLNNNQEFLKKALIKKCKNMEKSQEFYYLGIKYDIIIMPSIKNIDIDNNKIYVPSTTYLDRWLKKETKRLFQERLDYIYPQFEEKMPYPNLKIRDMKTRWGVCNRKNNNVTLNSSLIKETIDKLDYVIVHELSHFVHFNHSSKFWDTVSKYCPNYKKIRKDLKE